jgi:hypothetical protein
MMTFPKYYEEWSLPVAGIDKVVFRVHDKMIKAFGEFHQKGNINNSYNLRYTKIKNGPTYYYAEFNAEIFNPDFNYLEQCLYFLTELAVDGIFKITSRNKDEVKNVYRTSFDNLFQLAGLEMYFDFEEKDFKFANIPSPLYEDTRYSPDYPGEGESVICAYNRYKRLESKSVIAKEDLEMMKFRKRVEFRLSRRNCNYLSNACLYGNYYEIFYSCLSLLAKKWDAYSDYIGTVPKIYTPKLQYAFYFRQIVEMASRAHIPYTQLPKTPKSINPYHHAKDGEADKNFIVEFIDSQDTKLERDKKRKKS